MLPSLAPLVLLPHSSKPVAEGFPQIVVQNLYTGLQEQVCAALSPAHLLVLHKRLLITYFPKRPK